MKLCPCGSAQAEIQCCLPYLKGEKTAPTPEALMRSRYTAFAKRKFAYLSKTMQGPIAQQFDLTAARRDAPFIQWLKLEVLGSREEENQGWVEFKAHFRFHGRVSVLHEKSQFVKTAGIWFYVGQE